MNPHLSGSRLPAVSAAFLVSAVIFLCAGIGLGLYMAASHDHSLSPVHAHTNLLGWVSSALMGLFHARSAVLRGRAVWIQFSTYTLGVVCMMAGLVGVLKGVAPLLPFVAVGTVLILVGVGLFGWAVAIAAIDSRRRDPASGPDGGAVIQTWESG